MCLSTELLLVERHIHLGDEFVNQGLSSDDDGSRGWRREITDRIRGHLDRTFENRFGRRLDRRRVRAGPRSAGNSALRGRSNRTLRAGSGDLGRTRDIADHGCGQRTTFQGHQAGHGERDPTTSKGCSSEAASTREVERNRIPGPRSVEEQPGRFFRRGDGSILLAAQD